MRFVRYRREHFIWIAEFCGGFEHFRVMQQRAIKHAVSIDEETIIDVETRVEDRAIHVPEGRMLARRSQVPPTASC